MNPIGSHYSDPSNRLSRHVYRKERLAPSKTGNADQGEESRDKLVYRIFWPIYHRLHSSQSIRYPFWNHKAGNEDHRNSRRSCASCYKYLGGLGIVDRFEGFVESRRTGRSTDRPD